jgi:hypothetical protein
LGADADDLSLVDQGLQNVAERTEQVDRQLEQVVADADLERIPQLIVVADAILGDADILAGAAEALTSYPALPEDEELARTLRHVDRLLAQSQELLETEKAGLVPVEIEMDEAMLTALVQRFDLINERGALADTWRQIKLAGDDLKSVLNLRASQAVRTEQNRPFAFTFDESQTRLSMTFDAPLNRKAQRNIFRLSLVDYNRALRSLIEAEDSIKLSVRDQLRELQLGREQYQIAVASAALAYERVASTRLELQLGRDVSARDFLEAQQAFTASLNAVAREHIGYILDRIRLFLELEELTVDESGFWPELYEDEHQPTPYFQLPPYAQPAYGHLPPGLFYSHKIKRMLHVPPGCSTIFRAESADPEEEGDNEIDPPESIPPPEPTDGLLVPPEPAGMER